MPPALVIHPSRRFLATETGQPFFWLADTAWELFHRCDPTETELYLRTRAAQGFTVVQCVLLAELDGLATPSSTGHRPLHDNDPARPNEAYFADCDRTIALGNALGLTMAVLPTWGDKWNKGGWGAGPEIFTPENARGFGEYLGRRYRDAGVVWVLGGDRKIETDGHRAILTAMAEGLAAGDGGRHLRTLHPYGGGSSAETFHDAAWLDFNLWQTGHVRTRDGNAAIAGDYARTPAKPVIDGEPCYEDHPADFNFAAGYMDDTDTRRCAYWALFAGAAGHTYGCHDVWQMWQPPRTPINAPRTPWKTALHLPGAWQMRHARALLESRPYFERVPDNAVLAGGNPIALDRCAGTRGPGYAMIYTPSGGTLSLNTASLSGDRVRLWWFDPRVGAAHYAGEHARADKLSATPPTTGRGQDWVLVADDAARDFAPPGLSL